MKTISEYITLLSTIKNTMTSKLNGHGLNTTGNTMLQMANKIGNIESGIKPNIFSQTTEPTTYDGIWINTDQNVNKLAQVEDFLSEWNSKYGTPMPTGVAAGACVKYLNKIILIGGWTSSVAIATVQIYDINTNTWSLGTDMPVINRNFAFGIENGKVYCAGGSTNSATTSYKSLYIYDIENNNWTTGTDMPAARSLTSGALYNGNFYCIGGWNGGTVNPTNTLYIYSILNNTWSTGANMPAVTAAACSIAYNGYIYYMGGFYNDSTYCYTTNRIYNITNNTWFTGLALPSARYSSFFTPYNDKLYLIGGWTNGTVQVNTNYIYNTSNNTWSAGTTLPDSAYISSVLDAEKNLIYGIVLNKKVYIYSLNGPVNISLYTSDTLIIQHVNSYQPYSTILTSSNSFIGSYKIPFTDVAINSINADIYYGDGSQWIKIKSAT